ncbi:MAG: VacB/RNase II family 3'-5' exoribonuclease, partial [Ruthenibacterium sp.]
MGLKENILAELAKKPRRMRELGSRFGDDKRLSRTVDELYREKKITCRQGLYTLCEDKAKNAVTCTLVKLGRSFGFAKPEDGSLDVFVPGRFLMGAMPGDVVSVSVFEHPRVEGSVEGEVVAVLEQNNRLVGTVDRDEMNRLVVIPDRCPNTPLVLQKGADGGAMPGDKVAVEITQRGAGHREHRASVVMRFGSADEAQQCARAILYGAGVSTTFPQTVMDEAAMLENASVSPEEIAKRKDLRTWPIFTIDSAGTKDIDDAVSVQSAADGGYTLGVHIADVSYYVRPGSALDAEAMKRATSVYYADSVIPMLPRELSNGICSLNEQQDRLAFSCLMQLDKNGVVTDYTFAKTVLRSCVKGVYSEINEIYAGAQSQEIKAKYAAVWDTLPLLHEVYEKRAALRSARGAMEIESGEAKLVIDEAGHCVDVVKRTRGESEQLIEELMLMANECAAKRAREANIPFVYRVHEKPAPERIETLEKALTSADVEYHFANGIPTQPELAVLLTKARGTSLERFVHTNVLRSMAKAKYEPAPKGHFGLALEDYAHFTSPIRRYPDLAIHRILTDLYAGMDTETLNKKYMGFAAGASLQASDCEVIAMQAERAAEDCYKAEYMRQFIGDEFDSVISSVTSFGVYVELP